jgi:glycosyltransferase involved in cell wall biosynthesis
VTTVVVCAKDEPRIDECLTSIFASGHRGQVIVVCADERTADLARPWTRCGYTVVASDLGSLPADRQLGADLATEDCIAFIDADHRLRKGDLRALEFQMHSTGADVLQARLTITPTSFWNRAESDFLRMTMVPGFHDMVGVAPTIMRREVVQKVRFADGLSIDDTDFMYRLTRDTTFRIAVGTTFIECRHDPRLRDYLAKFRWYGRGDGEFMASHPERRRSMLFHLWVRYPLVYSVRAVLSGLWRAAPYAVLQGLTRLLSACRVRA